MKRRNLEEGTFYINFDPPPARESLYITSLARISLAAHEAYLCPQEDHPENYTPRGNSSQVLDEYQFVYISEGFGRLRSFEREFVLHSGCLICLVPGEKHRYGPDQESPWTEYRIGFSGSIPGEWAARGYLDSIITVHTIVKYHDMLIPFEEAIAFSRNRSSALQPLVASCVMRIMGCLLENRNIQQGGTNIIWQVQEIFEKNIFYPIDMDELTRILHINYQQLRDRFQKETGLSPYQYFLQMKINKAKDLLQEGSLSIKEIAYKLSFDSPYYFSRLFKRKAGVSPSQWNNTTSKRDLDLWPEK